MSKLTDVSLKKSRPPKMRTQRLTRESDEQNNFLLHTDHVPRSITHALPVHGSHG